MFLTLNFSISKKSSEPFPMSYISSSKDTTSVDLEILSVV